MRPPNRTWEQEPKLFSTDSGIVGSEFPTSRLPDEILHGGVRALISVGNLATALGQPDKTRAALGALDLLVTLDPRMTRDGRAGPTMCCFDQAAFTSGYGRHLQSALFLDNYSQLAKPVTEAPPGVLEDWEIFRGLARRMNKPLTLMAYRWEWNQLVHPRHRDRHGDETHLRGADEGGVRARPNSDGRGPVRAPRGSFDGV